MIHLLKRKPEFLWSLCFVISAFLPLLSFDRVMAQGASRVESCPGVYQFYGPKIHGSRGANGNGDLALLFYLSSGRKPLLDCFRGSRMGGATSLSQYLPGVSVSDQEAIMRVVRSLQLSDPYIHSLGL